TTTPPVGTTIGGKVDVTPELGRRGRPAAALAPPPRLARLCPARLNPSDPRSPIVFGVAEVNMAVGGVPYLAYRLESPPGHPERVRLVWMDDANLPAEI